MRSFWVSTLFIIISLYSIAIGARAQGGDVSSILSRSLFEQMLKHRNDARCPGKGFYTYDAFIAATKAFKRFGTTGDVETRKREIAAFFAQTSHEATGKALNVDLINNPDAVAKGPTLSFKTALWFWMTPQSPKPSCHDVITRQWRPTAVGSAAGWNPGFGLITNIINGKLECGQGHYSAVEDRIGFYKKYCSMLGIGYGNNLDCYNQKPYA